MTYHCCISIAQKAISFIALSTNTAPDARRNKLTGGLIKGRWKKWVDFLTKQLDMSYILRWDIRLHLRWELQIWGWKILEVTLQCSMERLLSSCLVQLLFNHNEILLIPARFGKEKHRTQLIWISDKWILFSLSMSHVLLGGILVLEKDSLYIWNSNLTGCPVFSVAIICWFFQALE